VNDVKSTTYIYEYKLGDFLFEGDAVVEQYDPHHKPIVTIANVFIDDKRLPKPLQSDWLIDTLENHVLNLWTLEQRSKA
jgi:hypothetical protein